MDARGIKVVVVSFDAGPIARSYVAQTNLAWPVLVDRGRDLYRAYGMLRGHWWDIWGPSSWWVYLQLLLRGRRLRLLTSDPNQLGGDVLIDPDGMVRLHHVGAGPADRPTVRSILQAVPAVGWPIETGGNET